MIDSLNISCPCYIQDSHKNSKLIIHCTSCKKYQHKFCIKPLAKMSRYQCPFCQLKKGALFFNILYSLVDPSLVEFNPNNKILSSYLTFIPDTSVYSKFLKKFRDSPTAIIIRCLRFDKNGFSFHWPKMSKIFINDKIILDLTKKGSKLKDRLIALIPGNNFENENIPKKFFLYDSNIFKNEDYLIEKKPNRFGIEIKLNEGDNMEFKNFLISIDLCEIYKEAEPIIDDIPIINSKKEIKKILSNNEKENNIFSIQEKISLLDIYTETDRIEIPARGINCCHLNVFDLKTFLIINRKTNKFQCPYCKRYSNDLYIDGILYKFLKNSENQKILEVYIDKELNISIFDKEKKEENSDTNNNSNSNLNFNSNDETYKNDSNKNLENHNIEEDTHENSHTIRKFKRKSPNLIQIIEDESDNYENNNNLHENDKNEVNENDFNNNNCNIISDLGLMFNQIREDILSENKNKNSGEESKNNNINKNNNCYLNTIGNDFYLNTLRNENRLIKPVNKPIKTTFNKRYNFSFKKCMTRKRNRNEFNFDDEESSNIK